MRNERCCRGQAEPGARPAGAAPRISDLPIQSRAGIPQLRRQRAKASDGHRRRRGFYRRDYANVHRGVYSLSQRSTDAFEEARETTRAFLNAGDVNEIVFTRGATESIDLVAQSWGPAFVKLATRSLSVTSNIIRISYRGRCCASKSAAG